MHFEKSYLHDIDMERLICLAKVIKCCTAIVVTSLTGQAALANFDVLNKGTVRILSATEGSGALIRRNQNVYTVATAWHVIASNKPGEELWIMTSDNKKYRADESSIKKFPNIDMAVIKFTSKENYHVLSVRPSDSLKTQSTLYISGWPLSGNRKSAKISIGKLIATSSIAIEDGYSLIYTNKTLAGMSGGPIVDNNNEIVGLHGRGEQSEGPYTSTLKTGINQGMPSYYLQQYLNNKPIHPLRKSPESCSDYLAKANMSHKHPGGAKTTISLASKAFDICQDKTHSLFLMAYSSYKLGKRNQAISLYEKLKLNNSASATALANLAQTRMEKALIESKPINMKIVFEELNSAIELDPNNLYAINSLAIAYSLSGKIETALKILNYGLDRYPNNETLMTNLKNLQRPNE